MTKQAMTLEARAIAALQRTWEAIAWDTLQLYEEHEDRNTISSDEVQEAVSACGFVGGYPAMYGEDKEAVAWLEKQTSKEQDRILAAAFPLRRYGM